MSRATRANEGGALYHALNRANGRLPLFEDDDDYAAFEQVLAEAVTRHDMRLLAYCVMPDHFHLVLWPQLDGDLSRFMSWLTLTHTQRWHAQRRSAGSGHLYQGRFRSFPVQCDGHLLTLCRHVEGNARHAGLVPRAEDWPWTSLARRASRPPSPVPTLSPWPVPRRAHWVERVNAPLGDVEREALRVAIRRSQPYGDPEWQAETATRLGLQSSFRPVGRPRKSVDDGP